MNNRVINQLNTAGTCINLATSLDYINVWTGKEPADFATDFAQLQTDYAAVGQKVALAEAATGGATDAKAAAETVVENTAYVLTRALANHFKKTGDLIRKGVRPDYLHGMANGINCVARQSGNLKMKVELDEQDEFKLE